MRHRFTGYTIWELPFGPGKRFGGGMREALAKVIGGWQTSSIFVARTGYPPFRFMALAHELGLLEKVPNAGRWLDAE